MCLAIITVHSEYVNETLPLSQKECEETDQHSATQEVQFEFSSKVINNGSIITIIFVNQ